MEANLKKRLIGAAILVVIAAIVLPMFLSGPPPRQDTSTVVPLSIPPSPDRELPQTIIPISAADNSDPDRIAAVDTTRLVPPVPVIPAPVVESPPSAPAAPPAGATTPAAPAPGRAQTPAPTPAVTASAPTTIATTAGGRFWVSLGSYSQAANADRVIATASGRNIQVQRGTVRSGERDLIRLRAGPYQTRAQAEQARQLLLAAVPDARPAIEESSAATTLDAPAPSAGAAPRAGAWAVQVGAFGQQASANQLSERLRRAGFPAFVERRGENWAVRVGPYVRRTEAESQLQQLKSGQQLDGMIVAHSG